MHRLYNSSLKETINLGSLCVYTGKKRSYTYVNDLMSAFNGLSRKTRITQWSLTPPPSSPPLKNNNNDNHISTVNLLESEEQHYIKTRNNGNNNNKFSMTVLKLTLTVTKSTQRKVQFWQWPIHLRDKYSLTVTGSSQRKVRVPDSWLKGCGFESLQERWKNFLLLDKFSVLTHFGIRSTPVLLQQHVKDPGHSAKSAGGRLQLNTHAPYVCGFAWSDMVHSYMVYTELVPRWQQFHVAPAMPAL